MFLRLKENSNSKSFYQRRKSLIIIILLLLCRQTCVLVATGFPFGCNSIIVVQLGPKRRPVIFRLLNSEMLNTIFSGGLRAAHELADIHPAANSILGNSKYCLTLLWNAFRVITVSFPPPTAVRIEVLPNRSADMSHGLLLLCYSDGLHVFSSDPFVLDKLNDSMEKVRSDFAMETELDGGGMVGIQSARGPSAASTNPLNFSLRNFGTELR